MPKLCSKMFILFLVIFSFKLVRSEVVQVIDFKSEGHSFKTITNDAVPADNLVATKELAFCYRAMPRYRRDFVILKTDQFKLTLRVFNGTDFLNIGFQPLNGTFLSDVSRMLPICQALLPGKWFSVLFSIKFTQDEEHIQFFLNGNLCHQEIYPMIKQYIFYYKKPPILVTDL